jgi:hypothetical protein
LGRGASLFFFWGDVNNCMGGRTFNLKCMSMN